MMSLECILFTKKFNCIKQNSALHLGGFSTPSNQNVFVSPETRVNCHHFCLMRIAKDIPRIMKLKLDVRLASVCLTLVRSLVDYSGSLYIE